MTYRVVSETPVDRNIRVVLVAPCGHEIVDSYTPGSTQSYIPGSVELLRERLEMYHTMCGECTNAARNRALREADTHATAQGYVWDSRTETYVKSEQVRSSTGAQIPAPRTTPRGHCSICGAPASMSASRGPACPDHYDEMSE